MASCTLCSKSTPPTSAPALRLLYIVLRSCGQPGAGRSPRLPISLSTSSPPAQPGGRIRPATARARRFARPRSRERALASESGCDRSVAVPHLRAAVVDEYGGRLLAYGVA